MTELYFNGKKADLEEEETIVATYGNISFGEFSSKKGIKTNRFKLPITNTNKLIFENPDILNNASNLPYSFFDLEVFLYGVRVIKGLGCLRVVKESYEVEAIAGNSDFYTKIISKKLALLDLSEYDHIWNQDNIRSSWSNTEGYVYAYVPYGVNIGDNTVWQEYLYPQVFFHTVVKRIVLEAGYTIKGKVLTDERFLNHVVCYSKFPRSFNFEETIILSETLPDVLQSKVILDFLNIYGLMPNINQDDMTITFDFIDDILFNEPIYWEIKIDNSEDQENAFELDYGINNFFSFKSEDYLTGLKHTVTIENELLEKENTIYSSDFYVVEDVLYGTSSILLKTSPTLSAWRADINYFLGQIVYFDGYYYRLIGLDPLGIAPSDTSYWQFVNEKDIFTFKTKPLYGVVKNIINSELIVKLSEDYQLTKIVKGEDLAWPITYSKHYRLFDRIIKKTKVVELLIKLNYADINQLDFTRPYWFDRFNSLFVLEEVRQYKLNENDSTICRFIRI